MSNSELSVLTLNEENNNKNFNLIEIFIDDEEHYCKQETSLLEVCKFSGITVPRFCYHEMLSVSGNCRMCLVEVEGIDKPLASCVAEVNNGMSILLKSPFPRKARENIVELILLHHPLDCPICDQAGECDLQDQARIYGAKFSRFYFNKKGTEDKFCGPLIRTIMTRCITCTRCVRFCDEIAGVNYFGSLNRGENTEITPYVKKILDSEISGNVIELCPVGALNSKPISNETRPWELKLVDSIDNTDSLGSNIYLEHKETNIVRISPKTNKDINNSIISDKTRFVFDANKRNRIIDPFIIIDESIKKNSLENFFQKFNQDFRNEKNKFIFIVDGDTDFESLLLLKNISYKYLDKIDILTFENTYVKNSYIVRNIQSIENIKENKGETFIFGTNLKSESPILNATLKLNYDKSLATIYTGGLTSYNYNININKFGANILNLIKSLTGKLFDISRSIYNAEEPFFIFSQNLADQMEDFNYFNEYKKSIFKKAKSLFIGLRANSESLKYLNVNKAYRLNLSLKKQRQILLTNINTNSSIKKQLKKTKIYAWFSTHFSYKMIQAKNWIPIATTFESNNILLNMEHRPQKTNGIYSLHKNVFTLKIIICAMFIKYFNTKNLNINAEIFYISEVLNNQEIFKNIRKLKNFLFDLLNINFYKYKDQTKIAIYPIYQKQKNFYQNSIMTFNSKILQNCRNEIIKIQQNFC